jgi:hypothetical protein
MWSYPSHESFEQDLHDRISPKGTAKKAELQEKTLIVLDGIDRIAVVERNQLYNLLRGLMLAGTAMQIILTTDMKLTPEIQDQQLLYQSEIIEIPPLTDEDIAKYIEARVETPRDRARILQTIRNTHNFSDLGTNPLMLSILVGQLSEAGVNDVNLESMLESLLQKCDPSEQRILWALTHFRSPVSARTLDTFAGIKNVGVTIHNLERLASKGLIIRTEDKYEFVHLTIREYCERKLHYEHIYEEGGTLYLTVDPTLFPKEDIIEFLESLNALYVLIGGEELIIREDEIGRFAVAEVLV